MKRLSLTLVFAASMVHVLFAQAIPDSTILKIDKLFARWNNTNTPGCVAGIVRGDSLIFSKGYGLANLEYEIPNTPQTIYHMASISKQFTAFSILLLGREGKLKLDDDIRKYLPWFPDLGHRITIKNLLNHTSGIRDQWQLLAISGTRLDDVITQDQIVKILSRQRALNFVPGSQYMYSNSGFTLLAEIVKSITGKTLRQFTDSAIFMPLNMVNTHFHDNCEEVVKNRAYSYDRSDSMRFTNSVLSYSNAGATSLFTNIDDMSKWIMNFWDHWLGDQQDIDMLTTKGKLNNGKELNYGLGISVDTYKGWRQYSHGGADAGFRTYISVLPDLKMGFMVFSNLADVDVGALTYGMAGLFVNDTTHRTPPPSPPPGKKTDSLPVPIDTLAVKKYTGDYITEEGFLLHFDIKNGKFMVHADRQNFSLQLVVADSFALVEVPFIKVAFNMKAQTPVVNVYIPDQNLRATKTSTKDEYSDKELKEYTGIYYCPELDCSYSVILKDHKLHLANAKYNDAILTLKGYDDLFCDNWWISHLKMLRDKNRVIIGFEVNSGRVRHLKFNKTK